MQVLLYMQDGKKRRTEKFLSMRTLSNRNNLDVPSHWLEQDGHRWRSGTNAGYNGHLGITIIMPEYYTYPSLIDWTERPVPLAGARRPPLAVQNLRWGYRHSDITTIMPEFTYPALIDWTERPVRLLQNQRWIWEIQALTTITTWYKTKRRKTICLPRIVTWNRLVTKNNPKYHWQWNGDVSLFFSTV